VDVQVFGGAALFSVPQGSTYHVYLTNNSATNIAADWLYYAVAPSIKAVASSSSSGYYDIGTTRVMWGTAVVATTYSGVDNSNTYTLPASFNTTSFSVTANAIWAGRNTVTVIMKPTSSTVNTFSCFILDEMTNYYDGSGAGTLRINFTATGYNA
jgi:hypothetical protein